MDGVILCNILLLFKGFSRKLKKGKVRYKGGLLSRDKGNGG